MNIKAFFVDALGSALDLGIGTANDVLRHVTPDILATYLPRPLWARLFTACLGAPRVDAQLVVETIGVPNLCEHVPAQIIWGCIAELGARSLGQTFEASPPIMTRANLSGPSATGSSPSIPNPHAPAAAAAAASSGSSANSSGVIAAPPAEQPQPPPAPRAIPHARPPTPIPSIVEPPSGALAELITELDEDNKPAASSARPPARPPATQRFRQSNTGMGRQTGSIPAQRRPQATAPTPPPVTVPRRTGTEVESDDEWRLNPKEIAVDDSQLVDWHSSETTQASSDDDFSDISGRKR